MSTPAASDPVSVLSKSTKIVATLGPASTAEDVMRRLMLAGVNVFRLNFSHGTQDDKRATIAQIRRLSAEMSLYVAIMADLQGPKFRLVADISTQSYRSCYTHTSRRQSKLTRSIASYLACLSG